MNKIFFNRQSKSYRKQRVSQSIQKERRISIRNFPLFTFCTNSRYEGTWDSIGMRGNGAYHLFYGVDYDGDFWDNMFNERGTLLYPSNSKMDGFWDSGHMIAHRYFFSDNLCYGPYCEMPDRRFYLEIRNKLKPAGRSLLTNSNKARQIPDGCYDTGDGFYDPQMKCVYDPKDTTKIIRIPTKDQHDWIVKYCRKAWDEPIGYNPTIYENWQVEEQEYVSEVEKLYRKKLMRKSIDYLCYRQNKVSLTQVYS